MPKIIEKSSEIPNGLRPYHHHKVAYRTEGKQAIADCPFCGKEGKLSIEIESSRYRCWVCGTGNESGGGNALEFIRRLWEQSPCIGAEVAAERGYVNPASVNAWGVKRSLTSGEWLLPGYSVDGKLDQVYRRCKMLDKGKWVWKMLPTPGIWPEGKVHGFHTALASFDPKKEEVWWFEGPWDGIAVWEVARRAKVGPKGLVLTGSEAGSLIANVNVLSAPGCNVFREEWIEFCRGKDVSLFYDNDHPLQRGERVVMPGWDGMQRIVKLLNGIARNIKIVWWGAEGYDLDKPTGWDVRDHLSQGGKTLVGRLAPLADLLGKRNVPPTEWLGVVKINGHTHAGWTNEIEPIQCHRWEELETAWKDALQWRNVMGDVLSVMLGVCASTQQAGNQLFLQVIGDAGSAKTTLCDGLLVSKTCHHLEHLTGFHSGWKKPGDGEKDCSLLARINGKTLVTPEADVLMSSPRFVEIMSQQRRIFDGKSGATFKNDDEDKLYVGLRTPWIMAGTPALLDTDQSRLGDRFLRIIVDQPSEEEKRIILRHAMRTEKVAVLETSNGTAASVIDPKLRKAQALTGGYVDWLRATIAEQMANVAMDDAMDDRILDLAEITADLRARPNTDPRKQEVHDTKELPTRIARQLTRMAVCLAAVRNRAAVDGDVLRIVRKLALDTAHGKSLQIVRYFFGRHPRTGRMSQEGGLMIDEIATWMHQTEDKTLSYLMFLKKIDVVRLVPAKHTKGTWFLTDRVFGLYERVIR